ncbi:MAG: signal peptidase I [Candidatus Izimaplasma sp.]|nr:signal peptidase I [Candidatus Izimaplasma bacterium]
MENNLPINDNVNEEKKLMKKIKILIISFLIISIGDVVLFFILQSHQLFIFKLNREPENINNYGTYKLVSYILVILIILFIISFIRLIIITYKKNKQEIEFDKVSKAYNFFDFLTVIPVFFLIIMILNGFFFSLAVVDGSSMEPNFCSNDIVYINYNSSLEREDVIVFEKDKVYIKRIVGIPGDHLEITNDFVYINSVLIESINGDYIYDGIIDSGNYFVLGDNRDNSTDSRILGFVDISEIIGEVKGNLSNSNCQID